MPTKTPSTPRPAEQQQRPSMKRAQKQPQGQQAADEKRPTGPNTIVEANHTKDPRRGDV